MYLEIYAQTRVNRRAVNAISCFLRSETFQRALVYYLKKKKRTCMHMKGLRDMTARFGESVTRRGLIFQAEATPRICLENEGEREGEGFVDRRPGYFFGHLCVFFLLPLLICQGNRQEVDNCFRTGWLSRFVRLRLWTLSILPFTFLLFTFFLFSFFFSNHGRCTCVR